MRTIYLVRHGQTEESLGKGRCICRTDIPLSGEGRRQAQALGDWLGAEFKNKRQAVRIFTSPLSRCRETAKIMAAGAQRPAGPEAAPAPLAAEAEDSLIELSGGLWEGLPFAEIRERFSEVYEARGRSLGTVAPPGGESFLEGGIRLYGAVQDILKRTKADAGAGPPSLILVTHSGVIRGLLCLMFGWDPARIRDIPQPCGGVTRLEAGEDGSLRCRAEEMGLRPGAYPGRDGCRRLWDRAGLPEHIRAHQEAVAALAGKWAEELKEKGWKLDPELAFEAGLIHDIARLKPEHPKAGAKLLRREGYPGLAHIVRVHHGLTGGEEYRITEASLVFLADKHIQGDRLVSLEERFAGSAGKCKTPEAAANHERQYSQAMAIERNINHILGVER